VAAAQCTRAILHSTQAVKGSVLLLASLYDTTKNQVRRRRIRKGTHSAQCAMQAAADVLVVTFLPSTMCTAPKFGNATMISVC
jgi:hypothetical protein